LPCLQGVKGLPCIWRASPALAERFDLPIDLPFELVRLPAAQAGAAHQARPPRARRTRPSSGWGQARS